MTSNKDEKENPLIYYTIIIVAVSVVAYKTILEQDITMLITSAINISIIILGVTLLICVLVFSLTEYFERKQNIFSNKHIQIFTITIGIELLILALQNINYLHFTLTPKLFVITIAPACIILVTYYSITNYSDNKKQFTENIGKYNHEMLSSYYEIELAMTDIKSFLSNNPTIEKHYKKQIDNIFSRLKLLQEKYLKEYAQRDKNQKIEIKVKTKTRSLENKIITKLFEYFKERKTAETIPEWAIKIDKEMIREAVKIYEDYAHQEYLKSLAWQRAVNFLLQYKGLPNDFHTLKDIEKEMFLKGLKLLKEHKLEKESEETPEVKEGDEDLIKKYFYTSEELTAEQRHRFIHSYGYRLKPFIFIESGQRGNNLIIKNDTRKESDYHFCIKHLLANVHKKNSYIEYDIEQLRTDIMINVNGKLYAFEIETGNNKALQIERKIAWLNKHFTEWYIVCSRDNKKKYKKYVDKKKSKILTATEAYKKILEINHLT